jgi:hypothetical protein
MLVSPPPSPAKGADRKGERQGADRKGERFSHEERRNFSVEDKEEKEKGERVNRIEGNSVIKGHTPITSDQMRHMMEQLTILLSQNEDKKGLWYDFNLIYFIKKMTNGYSI